MNLKKSALLLLFPLVFTQCAELFGGDDDNNNDNLLALLLSTPTCGASARSGAAGNGTRYNFSGCGADQNAVAFLTGIGFTAQNVAFNNGLIANGSPARLVTNASSLSEIGEKKAGLEITYVVNAGGDLAVRMPATNSYAGPGFFIQQAGIQKFDGTSPSAFALGSASWGSSAGVEKTLCLEVHEEGVGAHIFGWEGSCDAINRGAYQFEQEDVPVTGGIPGDRIGLILNNVNIKSFTIYSSVIGTAGAIRSRTIK